jgi:type I restriction enzyme R subunit
MVRAWRFRDTFQEGSKYETVEKQKESYHLFDFFANCEYFEEKFPYDKVIELPPVRQMAEREVFPPLQAAEGTVTLTIPDPLKTMEVLKFALR